MHVNFERFDALEFRSCGPIDAPFGESTSDFDGHEAVSEEITDNELAILLLLASEAFSKNSQAELSLSRNKSEIEFASTEIDEGT